MCKGEAKVFRECRVRELIRYLLFAIGLLLIIFGIVLIIFYPKLLENRIKQDTQLKEGNNFYKLWLNPPYKIKTEINVYSVQNPDEILNGSRPRVSSHGPYTYDIKMWHEVLSINHGVVKYNTFTRFYFNQTESCPDCFLDSKVWIPNIVYQKFVEAASSPSMRAAQTALTTQTPFLEVSVDDMLFKGYKDPFLNKVCSIPFMNIICESVLDLPERIAFFEDKNATHQGTFEISNGEFDSAESLGMIFSWNGNSNLPQHWWNDDYATMINGTDGSVFKPNIQKTDVLFIFVPELCRSIYLVFDKESNYKGVPTYQFIVPEDELNSTNKNNEGFCYNSGKSFFAEKEECLPSGLIELSRCQKGEPPVIFSLPNFLYADEKVKRSILGMNEPSVEHDGIQLEVEPKTGTVLRIKKRSQVNVGMWKGNDITIGADLTKMRSSIIPVFSCSEVYEIDDESLDVLLKLVDIDRAASVAAKILICLGVILVTAILIHSIFKSKKVSYYMENRGEKVSAIAIHPVQDKPYSNNSTDRRYL